MTHTKGPWEVNPQYPASIRAGGAQVASVSIKNGVHPNNPPQDEAYANARLIAAAPEMLEALEYIKGAIHTYGNNDFALALHKADTALRKVKGE